MENITGLTTQKAEELLKQHGFNLLPSKQGSNLAHLLLSQFKNILSFILLLAVLLSFLMGDRLDGFLILLILLLNAFLGFWQEFKASRELEALRKLEVINSRVIRDGKEIEIEAKFLVPGDIVKLESGSKVPADGVLIQAFNLSVNESSLTGESLPVVKSIDPEDNQLFFGSTVTSGRGIFKVISTGVDTKFGGIALTLSSVIEEPTPLELSLDNLAKKVGTLAVVVAILVLIIRVFQGYPILDVFFTSVALMVAAVPEGLPAVITVLLAVGVHRMYKRKTVVRRMSAIESLGATTVVCTDKTGTLTKNEMSVKSHFIFSHDISHLIKASVICNSATLVLKEDSDGFEILGDTTEGALLLWANEQGLDYELIRKKGALLEEIPFDLKRRLMSVVFKDEQVITLYSKGSPEAILPLCNLNEAEILSLTAKYQKMASLGLRVLGVASRVLKDKKIIEKDLDFLGFVGIADTIRPEAVSAIQKANKAGIKVVMITGDNELTAKAIAEEVGLLKPGEEILTGTQLEQLSEEQLRLKLPNIKVFARVLPEHKLRIVKAYQSLGEVVTVTGDGVNDALALKAAHVGIAMGKTGTDVAKESADLVILDDNLATIIDAIEQGRLVYNNILKTVKFLLSGNFAEILLIIFAILLGLPTPLLPAQILWINFVTDGFPALALVADPASSHIMTQKPRKNSRVILDRSATFYILTAGFVIALITSVAFVFTLGSFDLQTARAVTFSLMVVAQMVFVFVLRRHHSPFSNKYLLAAVGFVLIAQALIVTIPELRNLFKI